MAVEIHSEASTITHEARHDLESFFWLLVWIVLRHTSYESQEDEYKDGAWHKVFDRARMSDCRNSKRAWLTEPCQFITVKDNPTLTRLLEVFRQLCQKNYNRLSLEEPWMTHADVLQLFNKALAKPEKWPKNDKAIPWVPPATRPGSIMGQVGSGKPRAKGTLSFTQSASQSASRPSPSNAASRPDAVAEPAEADDETGSESDVEMQDGLDGEDSRETGEATQKRSTGRQQGARQTSTTMSHASGSHETPPSSNQPSESNVSESVQHPSGYALRSSKKSTEKLRKTTRSNARSMGPPPVPRNRSGTSRSQSSSCPAIAGPSQRNIRAAKRSRTQQDEAEEEAAGTSHSPKRPRTAGQRSVERAKESSKAKGKKRAS